ncbi:OLC1v1001787C1 [Oldenlandia corymbosa var. corymbosa]|uniref:OLC1v1001787C1 n=1 Tax=Oldenlandia corymbosa var. corymbosa TaxID=529605 RepID=A0AAV1D621_OLDCO|nr:OLC1v1001787C1 [Oldenlandia corymbosa var. corymbosa]
MSKFPQSNGNEASIKKEDEDSFKEKIHLEIKKEPEEEPLSSVDDEINQKIPLLDEDFSPLSGVAFCHNILKKSHFKPLHQMNFPVSLHQYLPSRYVPATVICRGKTWDMMFYGDSRSKRFDSSSWRDFVEENGLKIGDALFWEVMEDNEDEVKLKVQIIKGDWPLELEGKGSSKSPITIR